MRERLTPLIIAAPLAALALAGCSDRSETASGASADAAPSATAPARDRHPLPGLWETTFTGAPGVMTMKICVGPPEGDDNPFAPPAEGADCSNPEIRDIPGGLSFEGTCTTSGMTVASRGTVTGDLRSAYRVEMTATTTGAALPPGMPAETTLRIDARRLGDCPAGVEPGAIVP